MNMKTAISWWMSCVWVICVPAVTSGGQNLVSNPGFEEDQDRDGLPDGWRRYAHELPETALEALTLDTQIAHGGKASAKISVSNLEKPRLLSWVSPDFAVQPGQRLGGSAWVRTDKFTGGWHWLVQQCRVGPGWTVRNDIATTLLDQPVTLARSVV
jgi:hypothetical protein